MRYLRFLDRVNIENHRTKSFNGFILPSLLISVLISSFVILVIMTICMTCYIWTERIDDSLAMLEDGRYTRRAIVSHIIWNQSMVKETCYLSMIQAVPRLPLLEGPYTEN